MRSRLYDIMKEKDELYAKPDFSDADGERAAELEGEFAEMDGWNAESDAATLLTGLGLPVEMHTMLMGDLKGGEKFKVLLAQALFGNPDILLLDEPTNNLDNRSVAWLEDFLMNFPGTLIVVSHDRWFLNNICTHIVDIDFNQVKLYVGNYDFWYESSKMMQSLMNDQKKRREDKIKELQAFIQRFSSNKSKAKQATSRRKLLDQLTIEQMPASSRRYPWVGFKAEREPGKDRLFVTDISKTVDGEKLLNHVSFIVGKEDKIAILGKNELAVTMLFKILMGDEEPDEGTVKWGVSTTQAYFPKDHNSYFENCDYDLIDWMRQSCGVSGCSEMSIFHPHHVIPCSEFVAAFIKPADHCDNQDARDTRHCCSSNAHRLIRPAYAGFKVYYAPEHGQGCSQARCTAFCRCPFCGSRAADISSSPPPTNTQRARQTG